MITKEKQTRRAKAAKINKNIAQVDGKAIVNARTIDDVTGKFVASPYTQTTAESYENYINGMNKADLWEEALKSGIKPLDNVPVLRSRLMSQFSKVQFAKKRERSPSAFNPQAKVSPQIKDLLSRGK